MPGSTIPDLDVDADSVLVLRGCGPRGYPGMPEVANLPLPKKLLEAGVRDMVRICDGRMSGTAYGTVVLHVSPEAAAGGPLGLIRTGDVIVLDVAGRRLEVELRTRSWRRARRRDRDQAFAAPTRGWERLYVDSVLQADTGADLDFLVGSSGTRSAMPTPRPTRSLLRRAVGSGSTSTPCSRPTPAQTSTSSSGPAATRSPGESH